MKVVLYARVSTDDKGQDPEVQFMRCREYCKYHNHEIVAEYKDEGVTGDSLIWERPSGIQLKEILDSGKAKAIVVFSVDRYSRQNPIKVLQQIEYLEQQGIKFISVTEPVFDMTGEFSQPIRYFITWFSNYFLLQHQKKVKSGMEKAKLKGTKSGKSIGRPKLAGWHRNRILEMRSQNFSIRKIAQELNLSVGVVHKTLQESTGDSNPPKSDVQI